MVGEGDRQGAAQAALPLESSKAKKRTVRPVLGSMMAGRKMTCDVATVPSTFMLEVEVEPA